MNLTTITGKWPQIHELSKKPSVTKLQIYIYRRFVLSQHKYRKKQNGIALAYFMNDDEKQIDLFYIMKFYIPLSEIISFITKRQKKNYSFLNSCFNLLF